MAGFHGLWQATFPEGSSYGAKNWVPRDTVWARIALFVALFLGVWCLVLGVLRLVYPKSKSLHGVSHTVWALKSMMLFHHVISGLWASSIILADPVLKQILSFQGGVKEAQSMLAVFPGPRIHGSESPALLVPFTVAYMTTDLLLFPFWAKDPETKLFIVHHVLSILYWSEGLHFDGGQRYVIYFISTELTGGFLVLRWMLSQAGMKSSLLYAANGTIFTTVFLLVRVLTIPAILRSTLLYFPLQEPWKIDPPSFWLRLVQGPACLSIYLPLMLNAYWSVKVVKGYMSAVKSFCRKPQKRS